MTDSKTITTVTDIATAAVVLKLCSEFEPVTGPECSKQ